jgi:predicted metal-dependent phosphotriesterase family hydrolase
MPHCRKTPDDSRRSISRAIHPGDQVEVAIGAMKREGISDADIDMMMRKNPARLLGLI